MTLLLAGDIGGTKTILCLVRETQGTLGEVELEERYSSDEFPDLVPMVKQFLAMAEQRLSQKVLPQKACFAIAGPVVKDTCILTNLNWTLDARRLEKELNIAKIAPINDFAAVGYGVLGLKDGDIYTLQEASPEPEAPIAAIGAGTGLGQGFLIPGEESYRVFSSEGGHASFAARNELEFQLLEYIRAKYDLSNVSVERVVSGQGIAVIYQFLRDRGETPESPEIGEIVRKWEQGEGVDAAAAISQRALENRDRLCEQTLNLFVEAYGAEAGNLALKLLPYGGLYIAGGIAAKILPLMQTGGFLQAFLDKGRMRPLLEKVPLKIILNPQVGLLGAAIRAASLGDVV